MKSKNKKDRFDRNYGIDDMPDAVKNMPRIVEDVSLFNNYLPEGMTQITEDVVIKSGETKMSDLFVLKSDYLPEMQTIKQESNSTSSNPNLSSASHSIEDSV